MRLRILVVDDDADSVRPLCDELTERLADAQCEIVDFNDVTERLETYDPHIVVLDLVQ